MSDRLHLTRSALCVFSDRYGGGSSPPFDELNLGDHVGDAPAAVEGNRARLAVEHGFTRSDLFFLRQVHGRDVVVVNDAEGAAEVPAPEADAAVTTRPGCALVVLVADCAPVVLAADDPPIVAVAHAGRRGMATGVVPATIDVMSGHGTDPARIVAHLGPAICGSCYEVPAELQAEVGEIVPESLATTRSGSPSLDIRAGITAQLRRAGVRSVAVDHRCTRESPELFSHRRDGRTGRFGAMAWLTSS